VEFLWNMRRGRYSMNVHRHEWEVRRGQFRGGDIYFSIS